MRALEGIRIVDLSRVLAGPVCTMMLGDLGADVIKIESPAGDEARRYGPPFVNGESAYFFSINRNKRSLTLNLKDARALEVVWQLIDGADVVVENFSPGTAARLGLGYEQVRARHADIVYCSISGFGQTGPSYARPAFDLILQGLGGLMSVTGQSAEAPTKVGVPIADLTAGMLAAQAVLAALFHRARTGEGQYVETSLLDGQIALLCFQATSYLASGAVPVPVGNSHPAIAPYDTLRAADGAVNVAVGNETLWAKFCQALELGALAEDARYASNRDRVANRRPLLEAIEERTRRLSADAVLAALEAAGVPCGRIHNLQQVFSDPQVLSLGHIQTVSHAVAGEVRITGVPIRFGATPAAVTLPPPALGQHTEAILTVLGYSPEQIQDLRDRGAI